MSSGSLRETVRAVIQALSAAKSPYPLPDSLQNVLEAYLDKHERIEDQDSQRLHDELLNLYHKFVSGDDTKHATFLAILRELRPAITGVQRLTHWWEILVRPTIDSLGQEKAVVLNARGIILSILIYEDDADQNGENAQVSALFTKKLLDVYLEKTKLAAADDEISAAQYERSRFMAQHLESVLVAFGRKKPKDLLTAIDSMLVKKESRAQGLNLLCTFVRFQPPHLYQVLETPLIEHLLKCLTIDTSSTAISLALLSLIMFLPHIPNSLAPYLPRLFVIYSRILCWERQGKAGQRDRSLSRSSSDDSSEAKKVQDAANADPTWETLHRTTDSVDSTIPDLIHYFTFLYGLYPLNFMSYIRKPSKYLREAKFEGADSLSLDHAAIRLRTEQFRAVHLLHPNFYNMSIESELTDLNRFMKSEPSDVVAECMGLCAALPANGINSGPPPDEKLPPIPESFVATEDIPAQSLLSAGEESPRHGPRSGTEIRKPRSNNSLSQTSEEHNDLTVKPLKRSARSRSDPASRFNSPAFLPSGDSPTLPAQLVQSNSDAKLKDMLQTQESLRSGLRNAQNINTTPPSSVPGGSSPQLNAYTGALSQQDGTKSPGNRSTSTESNDNAAALQREVLLLRNELNFERYLKQQHLSHIGQLQGKHIREAAAEAETQNLINTNRALRIKVEEAKRAYAMLRKEAATSKNHAKKWEGDMNSKTRAVREDQKHWKGEEQELRRELQEARQEAEQLRKLVVDSEAKELVSKQKLQSMEANLAELDGLREEVEALNERLKEYEAREDEFELAHQNEEIAQTQLESVRLKLKSRDVEREKMKKFYEQRLTELDNRLQSAQVSSAIQSPHAFQTMLDSALSASNTRFERLKKVYNQLLSRYSELELRCMELQAEEELGGSPSSYSNGRSRGDESFDFFGEDDSSRDHRTRHHALSDPSFPQDDVMGGNYGMATTNPISFSSYPNRPTRLESLQSDQDFTPRGNGILSDRRPPFEASLHSSRKQQSLPDAMSGSVSLLSAKDSEHSGTDGKFGDKAAAKIKPKSEVRVYGRGGVQNIGKKDKKEKDKDPNKKPTKTGLALKGIRGLS
ncbi:MAG: hypothetical protein M1825_003173 [Sarcosagium campestre]|nr:MAG: hypothetical protein M1825_003173 [Sarcosagium campestre]